MITLKQWLEVVDYKITESSHYCWECYGSNAFCLDSWNGDYDGFTSTIIFDTKTQEVYEAAVYDYKKNRAYRLINPNYREAYEQARESRKVDDFAWDDVKFVDLEVDEDFVEKTRAIFSGEEYDTRVSIPLELPNDVLYDLMRRAHDLDITFNQLIENIIRDEIARVENGQRIFS